MQTFLASYNPSENATFIDNKRLFKQLLGGYTLLDTIINHKINSWANHPACKQWNHNPAFLYFYITSIWKECQKRKIAIKSEIYFKSLKLLDGYISHPPNFSSDPSV